METNMTTVYAHTLYCPSNMCRHTASEVIFTANKSPFSEELSCTTLLCNLQMNQGHFLYSLPLS